MTSPSTNTYFSTLEIARGVAALMVLLFHASAITAYQFGDGTRAFGQLFLFGRAGVDFFFVLSGFIITYIHYDDIGESRKIPVYIWKRFSRIFPPYWIASIVMIGLYYVSMLMEGGPYPLSINDIMLAATLIKIEGITYPLGVAWSLADEMFFYFLFGFALISRKIAVGILIAWFAAVIANDVLLLPMGFADYIFSVFHIEFFFGIATAVLVKKNIHLLPPMILFIVGFVLFAAAGIGESFLFGFQERPALTTIYGLASALMIFSMAKRSLSEGDKVYSPALMLLGNASYSIYLMHIPLLLIVTEVLSKVSPAWVTPELGFLVTCPIVLAGTFIFHKLIEAPLLHRCRIISRNLNAQLAFKKA